MELIAVRYCRTLRFLDSVSSITYTRALKMAQQEEAEIAGCTFQPSVLRRRSNAARSRASGTVRSSSYDAPGEGGKRGSAVRSEGADPVGRESGLMSGRRLFEESKRLNERRSQEQERKRVWEEESFARSCTFQVCARAPPVKISSFSLND